MILSLAIAVELDNRVKFMGAWIHNIVDYFQGLDLVSETSRMTYLRIVWIAKMMLQNKSGLLLVRRLSEDETIFKTLEVTLLDDRMFYLETSKDQLLHNRVAISFVKNPKSKAPSIPFLSRFKHKVFWMQSAFPTEVRRPMTQNVSRAPGSTDIVYEIVVDLVW